MWCCFVNTDCCQYLNEPKWRNIKVNSRKHNKTRLISCNRMRGSTTTTNCVKQQQLWTARKFPVGNERGITPTPCTRHLPRGRRVLKLRLVHWQLRGYLRKLQKEIVFLALIQPVSSHQCLGIRLSAPGGAAGPVCAERWVFTAFTRPTPHSVTSQPTEFHGLSV